MELFNDCVNVVFGENGVFNTVKLNGSTCVLACDYLFAKLNCHRNENAVLNLAGANCYYFSNLGLFLCCGCENDTAVALFLIL